jgi:N-acetylglucosaminylphosphatidylinositol deacetylase
MSLHAGARAFLSALMRRHTGWACPVQVYSLGTVGLVRKYASVFDAVVTIASMVVSQFGTKVQRGSGGERLEERLLFVAGPKGYARARRAMTTAHRSQMRWFRWGWIGLSRYMVVNDLRLEKLP